MHEALAHRKMKGVPVLIYATKIDLPRSIDSEQLIERLNLRSLDDPGNAGGGGSRKWHIQRCNVLSGDGLYEGLDWLNNAIYPAADNYA